MILRMIFLSAFLFNTGWAESWTRQIIKVQRKAIPKSQSTTTSVQPVFVANAQYRIAIIDSGYDLKYAKTHARICSTGSLDFTYDEDSGPRPMTSVETLRGTHPHGTWIANIIAAHLQNVDYCLVIYQVGDWDGSVSMPAIIAAVNAARMQGLVAVNVSLNGSAHKFDERLAVEALLKKGTMMFVAAGNDHLDLSQTCIAYPSCYSLENMYVIGANQMKAPLKRETYSNYGAKVMLWYPGQYDDGSVSAQGTSFAAPRALADFVLSLSLLGQSTPQMPSTPKPLGN